MVRGSVKYRAGFDIGDCDALGAIGSCVVPTMLIHGKRDDFILPKHSAMLHAACRAKSREVRRVLARRRRRRRRQMSSSRASTSPALSPVCPARGVVALDLAGAQALFFNHLELLRTIHHATGRGAQLCTRSREGRTHDARGGLRPTFAANASREGGR